MKYAVILLRYLKGYAYVRAKGGFPERFLNLCYSGKINLWDVCLRDNILTFCVSRADFMKLRPVAHKSGISISIIKKTGLIYKYRKYSKRVGVITGMALFLTVHLILSMFVWCVDVKGNTTVSSSEILSLAEHYGLTAGTFKHSFDEIRASRSIAADYKGKITWLSVNIKGSLAVVELREDNRVIGETEDRPPCNIVADFDGVILSAETYYGDCMIKRGTGVKKGDLLINGAIINEDLSTTFYAAKGKITALHEKDIKLTEKKTKQTEKLKTVKEGYRLGIFGIEIPLCSVRKNEDTVIFSERKTLNINGYDLPFYAEKLIFCIKESVTSEKQEILSLEKIQRNVHTENANSTVVSKNESVSADGGYLTFIGEYTLIDFIGEEKPILSEK